MRFAAFTTIALLLAVQASPAQPWGEIKGQIVWSGSTPKPRPENVTADRAHCQSKGALIASDLVIDSKTKGVKNVLVWLASTTGGTMPINPALQVVPKDPIVIDQPLCAFVPRVVGMRSGQTLIIKNSSPVAHSAQLFGTEVKDGAPVNGQINLSGVAGGQIVREGGNALKAEQKPIMIGCAIHGFMHGMIGVFDHPYFAVTKDDGTFEIKDAPAGEFRIFVRQEICGWLHSPRIKGKTTSLGGSAGQAITIPAGQTLDLGKIECKPDYLPSDFPK
jgi:hypothetical protein